jgi:hypothetical protein
VEEHHVPPKPIELGLVLELVQMLDLEQVLEGIVLELVLVLALVVEVVLGQL